MSPLKTCAPLLILAAACLIGGAAAGGSVSAAPANDDLAHAVQLSGADASRLGDTNAGATLEPGEPGTVASSTGGASVWYVWTPAVPGRVSIDTQTSNFDTLLAAYTGGAVDALTEVASNDDDGDGDTSRIVFNVVPSTTYRIRVDGLAGASGTINLHLHEGPRPANDDFAAATVLFTPSGTQSTSSAFATDEPGEPDTIAGSPTGASIWYAWTAPSRGRFHVDLAGSSYDTLLAVYTGSAVNALKEVASNDDANPPLDFTSAVTFDAAAGVTYRIRVDGFGGADGDVSFAWVFGDVPSVPTGVQASAASGQATVSWTAPLSDGGTPVNGYEVTRYVNGVAQGVTSVGNATQATVTGLANGTAYTFRVAATSVLGTGAQSTASIAVTPASVPDAPALRSASPGDGIVALTWDTPASDGGAAVTGYRVYRGTSSGGETILASLGGASSFTDAGAVNGTTYFYMVSAVNRVGESARSVELSAIPATVPGPPSLASVVPGDATAAVTWAAPSSSGGAPITGYVVTWYTGGAVQGGREVGPVTQASVGTLSNGVAYTFRVAARNAIGLGALSAESSPITPAPPRFTLTVTRAGAGAGMVTSSIGGIVCGTTCSATLPAGTAVALTAFADAASKFAGWSGACSGAGPCTVTMDAARTVGASFALVPAATAPKKNVCVVPNVTGKTLVVAKRKLVAAHCAAGSIRRTVSRVLPAGKVISQKPKAGARRKLGARVALVVSLGRL